VSNTNKTEKTFRFFLLLTILTLMQRPAVFFDRDGTLIEDTGNLKNPEQIILIPETVEALRALGKKYRLFVVTNQIGVALGDLDIKDVEAVNEKLDSLLRSKGIDILQWYVCPHEGNDRCRTPSPYFLHQAAEQYDLDLSSSFMIGDHPADPQTATAAGAWGLFVLTGHGLRHLDDLDLRYPVFHHIGEAATWILAHPEPKRYFDLALADAAAAVRRGELAVFPTETVYGLGADATKPEAVAKIFAAKKRPLYDPLIVHVAEAAWAESLVRELPEEACRLMDAFWPGPLTLVLPKSKAVPDIVTAGKSSVALRMPSNPLALRLIKEAGVPIAAPSANLFGRTSPTTAAHVRAQLEGSFSSLIDGGSCRIGVESTVLSLADLSAGAGPRLLRAGGLALEEIEKVLARVTIEGPAGIGVANDPDTPNGSIAASQSPGLLPDHYAPVSPLRIVSRIEEYRELPRVGKILFSGNPEGFFGPTFVLSPSGSLQEAAVRLYHAIQLLDEMGLDLIVSESAPDYGLGRAINDRLQKAAEKKPKGFHSGSNHAG
jgi:L-threonylcarbamoyladenylate synthase